MSCEQTSHNIFFFFKRLFFVLGLALLAPSCAGVFFAVPTISLQEIASGFHTTVELLNSGDGSGRLFVVE